MNDDYVKNPKTLLETIQQEVANGYGCEALTFCVKMTLGQAIELKEKMKSNPDGLVVLDKKVACGLFDACQGNGSVLEIVCEKDVEIPFANIWKFYADEYGNRYDSIHNVYAMDDILWMNCLKEIKS